MRTALLLGVLIVGCAGGQERPAEEAEAPSESEEAEGFSPEQQKALSELLGEDATTPARGEDESGAAKPASSSAPPAP
jgi:hypothetical protein